MRPRPHTLAVLTLVAPIAAACVTKGTFRRELSDQRTALDTAIEQERQARIAGDSTLMSDLTALRGDLNELRTDLDSLRSEFGAKITALEEGMRFALPVHFAFDDATVRQEDIPVLDRFAQVTQKHYANSMITIEGFADPAGSQSYNKRLSAQRAEAVREYLVGKGIPAEQLKAIGYGEARQVVSGAQQDEPGAEQNRRVVFVIETGGDVQAEDIARSSRD
jgi:outer membrane protein OmpA-like peptidoglycan-associated protein